MRRVFLGMMFCAWAAAAAGQTGGNGIAVKKVVVYNDALSASRVVDYDWLGSVVTGESDPVFTASGAYGITAGDRSQWAAAYSHKTTEDALSGLVKVNGAGVYSAVTDNSANWTTGFNDRMKWDGGAIGLNVPTARGSLGLGTMATAAAADYAALAAAQTISGVWTFSGIPYFSSGTYYGTPSYCWNVYATGTNNTELRFFYSGDPAVSSQATLSNTGLSLAKAFSATGTMQGAAGLYLPITVQDGSNGIYFWGADGSGSHYSSIVNSELNQHHLYYTSYDGHTFSASNSGRPDIEAVNASGGSLFNVSDDGANFNGAKLPAVDVRMHGDTVSDLFWLDASADTLRLGGGVGVVAVEGEFFADSLELTAPLALASGGTGAATAAAACSALGVGTEDTPTFTGMTLSSASGQYIQKVTSVNAVNIYRFVNSSSSPNITLYKSRGATIDAHAQVLTDDTVLGMYGYASDGTAYRELGGVQVKASANVSSTSSPSRLEFRTTTSGAVASSVKATLSAEGNFTLASGSLIQSTGNAPASATAAGTTGQIAWDSGYLYVCVSGGNPGTWKRAPLSTW